MNECKQKVPFLTTLYVPFSFTQHRVILKVFHKPIALSGADPGPQDYMSAFNRIISKTCALD